MPLKVKKNKKPKTPKSKTSKSSMSQKQSVKQSVVVNLGKPKRERNVGLQKVAQQAPQPQPNLSIMTNVPQIKSNNDSSLLFRELFDARLKKLEYVSPFERMVASQAAQDNRALQAQELVKESIPRRKIPTTAERLGLDIGTIPQPVGEKIKLSQTGTLGFSRDERLTEAQLLENVKPQEKVSADFLREQRLFHLKKPYNSLERLVKSVDTHVDPTTVEEVLSAQTDPTPREAIELFAQDHDSTGMESPDRKADHLTLGAIMPPNRLDSYLREGTSGDELRQQRAEYGVSEHEQGEDLADAEALEATKEYQKVMGAYAGVKDLPFERELLGQGEGIFGELAREERQGMGVLETPLEAEERRRRGRPMKPRPESIEPTTGKGRKATLNTPEAIAQRDATRAHRARAKEAQIAAQTEAYRGIQGFFR